MLDHSFYQTYVYTNGDEDTTETDIDKFWTRNRNRD